MTEFDDSALEELIEQAHQGDDRALVALIARAERGDQAATGWLCKIAARALYAGGPIEMNPALRRYLAASLSRVEDVELALAFAPLGPVPAYIRKARKEMNELALVIGVDRNRSTQGLTTSKAGDPGPVFVKVGEMFRLAPSTVRNRYYAWKNYRKTPKTPKNR